MFKLTHYINTYPKYTTKKQNKNKNKTKTNKTKTKKQQKKRFKRLLRRFVLPETHDMYYTA
jgi:hypothetical protein